jgi:hypothetical protein
VHGLKKHLFDYRFTYRAEYVRWRGKKKRPVFLTGVQPVEIVEVDPADALLAYRILSDGPGCRQAHEVRSFNGSLWWPVFDNGNPLTPSAFLALAATDWNRASHVLDPMRRTYYLDASSVEVFMAHRRVSEGKFWSGHEQQANQAAWDASRMIFCGDRVLVEAGEPVWYAVLDERAGRFDLLVGHSDLDRSHADRPHGAGFFTAGPDRNARIACGRLSLAFGLGETFAQQTISDLGHDFRFGSEIVALSERVPAPGAAAKLCVRASAQDLREIAWMNPDLRRAMPELADTSRAHERTDLDSDTLLLRHFVGRDVPALRRGHAQRVADACKVLDRWAAYEPLAERDEAALAALGG